jgi:hypothetical protein
MIREVTAGTAAQHNDDRINARSTYVISDLNSARMTWGATVASETISETMP